MSEGGSSYGGKRIRVEGVGLILNKVFKEGLTKKVTFEQKPEGVSPADNGRTFQAKGATCAKTLGQEHD